MSVLSESGLAPGVLLVEDGKTRQEKKGVEFIHSSASSYRSSKRSTLILVIIA